MVCILEFQDLLHKTMFHNQRGTAQQWMKEGEGAVKWTRLSCQDFERDSYDNNGCRRGGVFSSGRRRALKPKKASERPPVPEKNRGRTGKGAC
jgi:hypothetical protein